MNFTDFDNIRTESPDQAEQTGLCTAAGLVYRAYKRPYDGGPANVLSLFANGYYGNAPWKLFFVPVNGKTNHYRLMEVVPRIFYYIVSYYAACYCSQIGLPDLGDTVFIEDARGVHEVNIEEI
jgi:hypothetical protein